MSINEMYNINTKDSSFDRVQNKMVVSFCNRIRLITGCFPNKSMKRMVEKGNRLLERELDLLDILKRKVLAKKLQTYLSLPFLISRA